MHYFLMNCVEAIFSIFNYVLNLVTPVTKQLVSKSMEQFGVRINGNKAHDIQVKDDRFYSAILARGGTGICEAYIEGYFECDDLDECFQKWLDSWYSTFTCFHPYKYCKYFVHKYFDVLDIENTKKYVNQHYEDDGIGGIIPLISDEYAQYSSMMLESVKQIKEASVENLKQIMNEGALKVRDLYARKLKLEPGMRVLEIGCGYGGLAKHLAEKYDVHVTGVTLSKGMAEHAKKVCKGLNVHIEQIDYRLVTGKFDRIVSIQMLENVGKNHHREYFEKVSSLLNEDGLFLMQTHDTEYKHNAAPYDPLFEKYCGMFCYFAKLEEVLLASKGLFILENIQNHAYRSGLNSKALLTNLKHHRILVEQQFGEKHYRAMLIYLSMVAAVALNGKCRLFDYVFTKQGLKFSYDY